MDNKYTIKLISSRTGLSPQLIRTWESRYQAILPERTATNRRLYSESDLEKLTLLKRATAMGLAISTIAKLTIEELYQLVDKRNIETGKEIITSEKDSADYHLDKCISAVIAFDYAGLESVLLNASSSLGQNIFIEKVIHPLMIKTGELWHSGEFQIMQEHMVSTIVRSLLGSMLVSGRVNTEGLTLLVTTPSRQLHELGALMSAVTAISLGWKVVYLGPNLPVEDIANAIGRYKADAIALSITYPTNDPALHLELQRLRKIIGNEFSILIGGQGAVNYKNVIDKIQGIQIDSLTDLKYELAKFTLPPDDSIN